MAGGLVVADLEPCCASKPVPRPWRITMKRLDLLVVPCALAALCAGIAHADDDNLARARLIGFQEVPALASAATGTFEARLSPGSFTYQLSYQGLEGSATQAHIHFGQKAVNGGISVFLCSNLGNGPAGTQPCPPAPATITGTITANDVSPDIPATLAARNQGLGTGEFAELLAAMRAGATYVNVHSTKWPRG